MLISNRATKVCFSLTPAACHRYYRNNILLTTTNVCNQQLLAGLQQQCMFATNVCNKCLRELATIGSFLGKSTQGAALLRAAIATHVCISAKEIVRENRVCLLAHGLLVANNVCARHAREACLHTNLTICAAFLFFYCCVFGTNPVCFSKNK